MRNPFHLAPEQAQFGPELLRAEVDELYKRTWAALGGLFLVLLVMRSVLRDAIPQHPILGWVFWGMIGVIVLRSSVLILFGRLEDPQTRLRAFMIGSTLIALGFGLMNIISYPLLEVTDVALMAIMSAGICSGALMSMGSSFKTYAFYAVPNLGSLLLAVAFGPQTRWTHHMIILGTTYLAALVVLSLQQALAHRREVLLRLEMAEMALRDNLTQLRNRRALIEFMSSESEHVMRSWKVTQDPAHPKVPSNLGILMVDVDHFKAVNDTYGHGAGDEVLKQLAAILVETARKPDLVVRWGGEEFVIVARDVDRRPPSRLAERIRERVEQHPFLLPSGQTIQLTCSSGYSTFPFALDLPDLLSWEQIITVADAGMYFAKTHGRNRSVGIVSGSKLQIDSKVLDILQQSLEQAEALELVDLVV